MAKLIFTNKDFSGKEFELKREITTVGRASDNLLEILDKSVSAHHCVIQTNGPEVIIEEKDSKNGTYVDEQLVKGRLPIRSGQTIRLGEVELRLEIPFEEDPDTEITTILSYDEAMKKIEEQENKGEDDTAALQAKVGDKINEDGDTIIFTKQDLENKGSGKPEDKYKEHEPQYIIPEPKSSTGKWLLIAGVVIVVVSIAIYMVTRG